VGGVVGLLVFGEGGAGGRGVSFVRGRPNGRGKDAALPRCLGKVSSMQGENESRVQQVKERGRDFSPRRDISVREEWTPQGNKKRPGTSL